MSNMISRYGRVRKSKNREDFVMPGFKSVPKTPTSDKNIIPDHKKTKQSNANLNILSPSASLTDGHSKSNGPYNGVSSFSFDPESDSIKNEPNSYKDSDKSDVDSDEIKLNVDNMEEEVDLGMFTSELIIKSDQNSDSESSMEVDVKNVSEGDSHLVVPNTFPTSPENVIEMNNFNGNNESPTYSVYDQMFIDSELFRPTKPYMKTYYNKKLPIYDFKKVNANVPIFQFESSPPSPLEDAVYIAASPSCDREADIDNLGRNVFITTPAVGNGPYATSQPSLASHVGLQPLPTPDVKLEVKLEPLPTPDVGLQPLPTLDVKLEPLPTPDVRLQPLPTLDVELEPLPKPIYSPGALMWARVSPKSGYWPSIVQIEKKSGNFFKVNTGRNKTFRILYHVIYYADECRHSWVTLHNLLPYRGKDDLLQKAKKMKIESQVKSHIKAYETRKQGVEKSSWEIAVGLADSVKDLSNAEVLEEFFKLYPDCRDDPSTVSPQAIMNLDLVNSEAEEKDEDVEHISKKTDCPIKKLSLKKKIKNRKITTLYVPKTKKHSKFNKQTFIKDKKNKKTQKTLKIKKTSKAMKTFKYETKTLKAAVQNSIKSAERNKKISNSVQTSSSKRLKLDVENSNKFDSKSKCEEKAVSVNTAMSDHTVSDECRTFPKTLSEKNSASVNGRCSDTEVEALSASSGEPASTNTSPMKRCELLQGLRKDKVCKECHLVLDKFASKPVLCQGGCYSYYHLKCAKQKASEHSFVCHYCKNDDHRCQICLSRNDKDDFVLCSVTRCGQVFHRSCLRDKWPQTQYNNRSITCPLHTCHTCSSDQLHSTKDFVSKDKLVRCLKCPTAYHADVHCIPASTTLVTTTTIICPKHVNYSDQDSKVLRPLVSASWCFICVQGGKLVCCENCPATIHKECLSSESRNKSPYICEDCQSGRHPLYSEIVWVKHSSYRWWPAKVVLPQDVPEGMNSLPHNPGEFVVKFYGSNNHTWTNNVRTFPFQEEDKTKEKERGIKSGRMKDSFDKGLDAAHKEHMNFVKDRDDYIAAIAQHKKPAKYRSIRSNKAGSVKQPECDKASQCFCDPNVEYPCGIESNCINRSLLMECDPKMCKAGESCCNRMFTLQQTPDLKEFYTTNRGWGLRTEENLDAGTFVIEYVGEIIDDKEFRIRVEELQQSRNENYYFLSFDNHLYLDAGRMGNLARFMNHSCEPNCKTEKWMVNGEYRVGLFTINEIPSGTELTFDYNLEQLGSSRQICCCGASSCKGFIGSSKIKNIDKAPQTKSGKGGIVKNSHGKWVRTKATNVPLTNGEVKRGIPTSLPVINGGVKRDLKSEPKNLPAINGGDTKERRGVKRKELCTSPQNELRCRHGKPTATACKVVTCANSSTVKPKLTKPNCHWCLKEGEKVCHMCQENLCGRHSKIHTEVTALPTVYFCKKLRPTPRKRGKPRERNV